MVFDAKSPSALIMVQRQYARLTHASLGPSFSRTDRAILWYLVFLLILTFRSKKFFQYLPYSRHSNPLFSPWYGKMTMVRRGRRRGGSFPSLPTNYPTVGLSTVVLQSNTSWFRAHAHIQSEILPKAIFSIFRISNLRTPLAACSESSGATNSIFRISERH